MRHPLDRTRTPFTHLCTEGVCPGKCSLWGLGVQLPRSTSHTSGFSAPGGQGSFIQISTALKELPHLKQPTHLPPGLCLPNPKKARQQRGMGAGSLPSSGFSVLPLVLSAPQTPFPLTRLISHPTLNPHSLHVPLSLPSRSSRVPDACQLMKCYRLPAPPLAAAVPVPECGKVGRLR